MKATVDFSKLPDSSPAALGIWAACVRAAIHLGTPGVLPRASQWTPENWANYGLTREEVATCGGVRQVAGSDDWEVIGVERAAEAVPPEAKRPEKSALQLRAEALFRRRATTVWGKSEKRAWEANHGAVEGTDDEEWKLLEWWFSLPPAGVFRRKDLATLLNNWGAEIDRAAAYRAEHKPAHVDRYARV